MLTEEITAPATYGARRGGVRLIDEVNEND